MGRVILPKRDGEFSLKYDSRLCKRFVADVGDVRVPGKLHFSLIFGFVIIKTMGYGDLF